jgi:DNA-binding NarL/FixJ family response regulator
MTPFVIIETRVVILPPVTEEVVHLTMTDEQARALRGLIAQVRGVTGSANKNENLIDEIRTAMNDAGYENRMPNRFITRNGCVEGL